MLNVQKKLHNLLTQIEDGDGEASALKLKLRDREAEVAKMRAEISDLERRRDVLRQHTLDALAVIDQYRELPALLAAAMKRKDRLRLKQLLQTIIYEVVWTQNRENPKQGEATMKLLSLPSGYWAKKASPDAEQPGEPLISSSGCQSLLPDLGSNQGHTD